MIEKAYTFGKNGSLVGIITEPNANRKRDGTPAVILWNAGLLHRVGPHRLFVTMARKLATTGFTVLRFDLSGFGDSEMHNDVRTHQDRILFDIAEAMDFLSALKASNEFVLIGLCSGADQLYPVAVADHRVSGAVLLDPHGYRTWKFYLLHIARRIFNLNKWNKFLKQKYQDFYDKKPTHNIFPRLFPPKKKVKKELLHLIKRGVSLLYVYTGGVQKYYNYTQQFQEMFGLKVGDCRGKLQVEYIKESDHLYTLLNDRNKLISTISNWLQTHFLSKKE
jgi:hypothetical protein